jgi:hypothetical protein
MDRVDTPQFRGRIGFARGDITSPVGIYHRLWGAAEHERSNGVHRPLAATALWLEPAVGVPALAGAESEDRLKPELQRETDAAVILALDQCLLDGTDATAVRQRVSRVAPVRPERVHVHCSHTHASGWMSRSRAGFPGGELIEDYLRLVMNVCADLARSAADAAQPATIVYGSARCDLAGHRDYFDGTRFVCGFNPAGPADDTVHVGRAIANDGSTLGTLVNYACHPTTLAWQNTLLSPDFVGAMREVVEHHTGAPCLFLQGASGDLGPRDGFVGDVAGVDRNGRQLGFAALSGLEALPPAGTRFEYAGPVVSGATLGIWKHQPVNDGTAKRQAAWAWRTFTVDLPYRPDLPTVEGTRTELAKWEAAEADARRAGDLENARDARAHVERMNRQLNRLSALPPGPTYPYPVTLGRLGTALWVLVPGELYQMFQTTLRSRFPNEAVIVATLTNDWQPGYLPASSAYGHGIYQEAIAVVAAGALETLTETVAQHLRAL